MYVIGLGRSSDSVTIVIVIVDIWLRACTCTFTIVSPQHTHVPTTTWKKTCEDGEKYVWWDRFWQTAGGFSVGGL